MNIHLFLFGLSMFAAGMCAGISAIFFAQGDKWKLGAFIAGFNLVMGLTQLLWL